MFENNTAEYGGLMYIERNNVNVAFSTVDASDITTTADGSAAIIHWICQAKSTLIEDDSDLCGELLIFDSDFDSSDSNIFTIDLSADPSEIAFNLDVDSSTFTNINGTIFNFNHNNDELEPSDTRIQEKNAFINIKNSSFNNNGKERDDLEELYYKSGDPGKWVYYTPIGEEYWVYINSGTIFTINSITVPNITIQDSNFTNNAGSSGAIFNWYCSRDIQWISKDSYCGSIMLQNSRFEKNEIQQLRDHTQLGGRYIQRNGSLINGIIHPYMAFDLFIQECTFIEQQGNVITFQEASVPTIDPCWLLSNGTYLSSNYSDCSYNSSYATYSNSSDFSNSTTSIIFDTDLLEASMINIKDSQFINCSDEQDLSSDAGYNSGIIDIIGLDMVYTYMENTDFIGNQVKSGSAIFSADYAPFIEIKDSYFSQNAGNPGLLYMFI